MKIDFEMIILCALFAIMVAIGILLGLAGILCINIEEIGVFPGIGFVVGMIGVIWGLLMLGNSHGYKK